MTQVWYFSNDWMISNCNLTVTLKINALSTEFLFVHCVEDNSANSTQLVGFHLFYRDADIEPRLQAGQLICEIKRAKWVLTRKGAACLCKVKLENTFHYDPLYSLPTLGKALCCNMCKYWRTALCCFSVQHTCIKYSLTLLLWYKKLIHTSSTLIGTWPAA